MKGASKSPTVRTYTAKQVYWPKNPYQCHCIHHIFHVYLYRIRACAAYIQLLTYIFPWRRKQKFSSKQWYPSTRTHGVTFHTISVFTATPLRPWNEIKICGYLCFYLWTNSALCRSLWWSWWYFSSQYRHQPYRQMVLSEQTKWYENRVSSNRPNTPLLYTSPA